MYLNKMIFYVLLILITLHFCSVIFFSKFSFLVCVNYFFFFFILSVYFFVPFSFSKYQTLMSYILILVVFVLIFLCVFLFRSHWWWLGHQSLFLNVQLEIWIGLFFCLLIGGSKWILLTLRWAKMSICIQNRSITFSDMYARLKAFVLSTICLIQQLQIVQLWFAANFPQLLSMDHEEEKGRLMGDVFIELKKKN